VARTCRINIDTDDDTRRIYPGCISQGGSRECERCENSMAQHKRVTRAAGVSPQPYNDARRVIRFCERERGARIVNRGEGPTL
jgi:hypothetical protein